MLTVPDLLQQLLFRNHPVGMLDKIEKSLKDPRFYRNRPIRATNFQLFIV